MDQIATVRMLAAAGDAEYEVAGDTYWSDEQIQSLIDANRRLLRATPLHTMGSYEDEVLVFKEAVIDAPGSFDVDQPGLTQTSGGVEVEATLSAEGVLSFEENVGRVRLYWTGYVFNLYSAAADLCEAWAAAVKLQYDVNSDGQDMTRSQKHKQLLEQAKELRARSGAYTIPMTASL